jgi:predicted ABC-type ATPase
MKQIPNKIDWILVKFINADHMAKRISGDTPPNYG